MSPAKYKAVLFDLDGTLLDTAPDFTTSINQLLERHQRPTLSLIHISEPTRPY